MISCTEYYLYLTRFTPLLPVVLVIIVTRVAKTALDKALAENEDLEGDFVSQEPSIVANDLHHPLLIKVSQE